MTAPCHPASPADDIDTLAHAFEERAVPVSLKGHGPEDWIAFGVFWAIVGLVFLQFFTRYALNNSVAWTEEVAVNALILLVFMGAAMCMRTSRHIHVDLLYYHLPAGIGKWLSRGVDLVRVLFCVWVLWVMWRYVDLVADDRLISVNVSRGWFLWPVLAAFAIMLLRSIQILVRNWRRGWSVLERPETAIPESEV